jgi:predicted dehydrogenase
MPFGIGVVGLDHWYTAFGVLDTCAASVETPLVAIAEEDPARRDEVAAKYTGAAVTADYGDLLARDDVELVAICAGTDRAPEIARRALAAGKHVVSVKPPARTLEELDGVIAAAEAAGRFYGSFEGMQRLHPKNELLRDLIAGGAIGTPLSYHQIGHGGLPSPWRGQPSGLVSWWTDPARVPGGAWLDHAIYAVDLARFVFGGEVGYAAGTIETRVREGLALEDYGASLMRLDRPGGAPPVTLICEDTWAANPGGGYHQALFLGTDGSIRPDGDGWAVKNAAGEAHHAAPASAFFRFDRLAALLAAGKTPPFGPVDARSNLSACIGVYTDAGRR